MSVTDNEEALNRKLYEKVSAEMEAYENELLAMPPEGILEHAYAYATKQDIVLALEEYDLSGKQAQALLRCDNALGAIFDRWEHTEMAYMDTIRDMIPCTANEKIRAAFKEKLRQGGRKDAALCNTRCGGTGTQGRSSFLPSGDCTK